MAKKIQNSIKIKSKPATIQMKKTNKSEEQFIMLVISIQKVAI